MAKIKGNNNGKTEKNEFEFEGGRRRKKIPTKSQQSPKSSAKYNENAMDKGKRMPMPIGILEGNVDQMWKR